MLRSNFKKLPDIKNPIQIYSVQHSGSRFLKSIFSAHGFDYVDIKHFTRPYYDDKLCVAPIRDPAKVWRSWVSKGRSEDFFQAWFNFELSYLRNPNLWVIPVDTPDREDRLQEFGGHIGKDFDTDWQPVGHTQHKERIPDIDLDQVYNLIVVSSFYHQ